MSRATFLALAASILGGLAVVPAQAQEQDAKTYSGTWSVRLQDQGGGARDATLVLDAYEGTWQDRPGKTPR